MSSRNLVYPVGGLGVARAYLGAGVRGIAGLYESPTLTFLGWAKAGARRFAPEALDCEPPEPQGLQAFVGHGDFLRRGERLGESSIRKPCFCPLSIASRRRKIRA